MMGYGPETYGDRWADVYDAWSAEVPLDTESTVEFLAGLADDGPVLELAIGTGRVALPLAQRGIDVHGVDASDAMVTRLREKPGGADIPVTMGDFADVAVEGRFRLVYVVFNTFFALLTQEDQVRCFRNVTDHLTDGGAFVIEAFVPDVTRFDRGQRVDALRVEMDSAYVEASVHDPVEQTVRSLHISVGHEGVQTRPVQIRYVWPSELDLMAKLAGLHLRERWGGWRGEPFMAGSPKHVSIYEKT